MCAPPPGRPPRLTPRPKKKLPVVKVIGERDQVWVAQEARRRLNIPHVGQQRSSLSSERILKRRVDRSLKRFIKSQTLFSGFFPVALPCDPLEGSSCSEERL